MLSLFNLQLREKFDKPFKTFLVPVDPEEVHLRRIINTMHYLILIGCSIVSTFLRLNIVDEMSSLHWYSHFGHFFFTCQYLTRKGSDTWDVVCYLSKVIKPALRSDPSTTLST